MKYRELNETKSVDTIRLSGIIRESIVDGPGLRFAVYCQGCPHNCEGCHNPSTHDFGGGKDTEIQRILAEVDKNPSIKGLTFSGGEPFCQPEGFLELAKGAKERDLDIVIFTGYTYEELMELNESRPSIGELISYAELIVDGRFEISQRDLSLRFRGSRNQRIIHVPSSLKEGKVVLSEKYMNII